MQNDNYSYNLFDIFCLKSVNEFIKFNEFISDTRREITMHGTDMMCDLYEPFLGTRG